MGQCKASKDGDDKGWGRRGVSTPGLQNSRQDYAAPVQDEAEAGLPKVKERCLSQSQWARHKTLSRDRQALHNAMYLARVPQNLLLYLVLLPPT